MRRSDGGLDGSAVTKMGGSAGSGDRHAGNCDLRDDRSRDRQCRRRARREARASVTVPPQHRRRKSKRAAPLATTTRPARRCGSGSAADGDAERPGLVDQVVGDARTRERDHALRQEVQQLVVAAERGGAAVAVPVRFVNNFCYLNLFRPGYLNNVLLLFNIMFTPETRRTSTFEYT